MLRIAGRARSAGPYSLLMLCLVACGRLRWQEAHRNSGLAPTLVVIGSSSTNYVTISNVVITTNFVVSTQVLGLQTVTPAGKERTGGASGSITAARTATSNSLGPEVKPPVTANVPAQAPENGPGPWWMLGAVLVLLGLVWLLAWKRPRAARAIAWKEEPPPSLAGEGQVSERPDGPNPPVTIEPFPSSLPGPDNPTPGSGAHSAKAGLFALEGRLAWANAILRMRLVPYLARLMTDKLIVQLMAQRKRLLHTQEATHQQLAYFDQRLAAIQSHFQQRVLLYERRIAELQRQLAVKEPPPPPPKGGRESRPR